MLECYTDVPDLYNKADVIATLSWLPPSPSSTPKVHFIQFFCAGTNHVAKHPIYTESEIPVTTASGIHGPQIAEWYTAPKPLAAPNTNINEG